MAGDRTDSELLDLFVRRQDEDAFRHIVARHSGLVYAAALRQAGPALAEDISQAVFFILSRKARRVDGRTLAGWLVLATRLTSMASKRMELRCKERERKAAMMKNEQTSQTPDEFIDFTKLAPLLDNALMRLGEKDRSAVTLRYLQGKSVRDVAAAMQISEAAAGKRATRAVQALRNYFNRHGVELTTESVGRALAANGVMVVPLGLAGKLGATTGGPSATAMLSTTATSLVEGTLPMMITVKTQLLSAAVAFVLIGGAGAVIATQMSSLKAHQPATIAAASDNKADAEPAALAPTTAPSSRESLTRYPTPPGERAKYSGRVEGLEIAADAEVGLVYLRGVHWISTANYQWQPLDADGTFAISADKFPEARRALAVRAEGQSVTYLRAEFMENESARDIVVKMKPVKPMTITAKSSSGDPLQAFKVEIFDASVNGPNLKDDDNRPLRSQRLDAPLTKTGELTIAVPLEPLSLLISGNGIAPNFATIDPNKIDAFEFTVHEATPIEGIVTDGGVPVVDERVMLNNDAVPLSYTARKTDGAGRFKLIAGIPGTYNIAIRGKKTQVTLVEGEPCHVKIELKELSNDAAAPTLTTAPASTH